MKSNRSRTKAYIILMCICIAVCMTLSACGNYKPPYQRGYDEGYSAGYSDGSSGAPEAVSRDEAADDDVKESVSDSASAEQQPKAQDDDSDNAKKSGGLTSLSGSSDDGSDKSIPDDNKATEEDTSAGDGTEAANDDTDAVVAESDNAGNEVLSESDAPAESGAAKSWGGRVIRAEAVNEAMYSNPEVIEGLRQLYDDRQIFGEFVGDSGTNKLHKVGGSHFSSLTFEELVVFDETKSVDDILNEGFYVQCECMAE